MCISPCRSWDGRHGIRSERSALVAVLRVCERTCNIKFSVSVTHSPVLWSPQHCVDVRCPGGHAGAHHALQQHARQHGVRLCKTQHVSFDCSVYVMREVKTSAHACDLTDWAETCSFKQNHTLASTDHISCSTTCTTK